MRVLLTGATGFIGYHTARALVARGHFASCLTRLGSEHRLDLPDRDHAERVSGDLTDPESLIRKPLGCDAVVNLAGIVREDPGGGQTFRAVHVDGVRNLLESCLESEVRRVVHVSALGAGPRAESPYRRSKFEGEEIVRAFPMRWTVLRPSMVYGPRSPTFRWIVRMTYGAPVLPVPVPAGGTRISPLWVGDLADGIAACLERPESEGRTLEVGGPAGVTVADMYGTVARARGVPHWRLGISAGRARAAARLLARLPGLPEPPGTLDLLGEDHVVDPAPFVRATGLTLTPLEEGVRRALQPAEAGNR